MNIYKACGCNRLVWRLLVFMISSYAYEVSCNNPIHQNEYSGTSTSRGDTCADSVQCPSHVVEGGIVMNCAYKAIREINPCWFPDNLRELNLDHNDIHVIKPNVFGHLKFLKRLTIRENNIAELQPFAFIGLDSLEYLNLEHNRLSVLHMSQQPYHFASLPNLKTLCLAHQLLETNNKSSKYSQEFFLSIHNVHGLSIHAVSEVLKLGYEMCSLQNLTRLKISGPISLITNFSFSGLECLEIMELTFERFHNIKTIEKDALMPFKSSLISLQLREVFIGLRQSFGILNPFKGRDKAMYEVFIKNVYYSDTDHGLSLQTGEGILNREMTGLISDICIERLSIIDSDLFLIKHNMFTHSRLATCLTHIDLSTNHIVGTKLGLLHMFSLPNIETLIYIADGFANEMKITERKIQSFPTPLEGPIHHGYIFPKYHNETKLTAISRQRNTSQTRYKRNKKMFGGGVTTFHISKKLKAVVVHMLRGSNRVNSLSFSKNNLQVLTCRNCGWHYDYDYYAVIEGIDCLRSLDLSYNDLKGLTSNLFRNATRIENLTLTNANLHSVFSSTQNSRVFKTMKELKLLDLSANALTSLNTDEFISNSLLETLIVKDNGFIQVPFDISLTPTLKRLDIRNNEIIQLGADQQRQLDEHVVKQSYFRLSLNGNPIICGCNSISFLFWLQSTQVNLDNKGNYSCTTAHGYTEHTAMYTDIPGLWRQCNGRTQLWLSCVLFITMTTGFLSVVLVNRHGNYIRAMLLSVIDRNFRPATRTDYTVDVFVGYADRDYRFPCLSLLPYLEGLGMKVYVRDRDGQAGGDMAAAIMEAVQGSWRVVLVVTEAFLTSDEWASFMMKAAIFSQSPRAPARVIVLVEERVQRHLPADLLAAVADDHVVVVDRMLMGYELKQRIKSLLLH